MLASALCTTLLVAAPPETPLTLQQAIEFAVEHAADMIRAREDVLLVDVEYAEALSAIMPRLDLELSAGEFFSGRRIIESRNPVAAQLPTELPQVTFGPFRDAQTNNYSHPQLSLALTGRQLIYDGGRWWKAIQRVDHVRDSREADLKALENEVRALTTAAFYRLEKARQARLTFEAQLDLDRAQLERAERLVAVGRGSPADVATARRNLAADEIQHRDVALSEQRGRRALNLQMGRAPTTPFRLSVPDHIATITSTLPARYVPDDERLQSLAKAHRPELTSLRAQMETLKKDIDIAAADYWPTISLQTRYSRSSRRPDRLINNPFANYIATLDLALQWNLFAGLSTKAAVERGAINLRKLAATYEGTLRTTYDDVVDGRAELMRQRAVYDLAREQIAAAKEAVRLARGLYEAGRGTALELRSAELGLTQSKLTAINARLEVEIAYQDLVRRVGTEQWQVK